MTLVFRYKDCPKEEGKRFVLFIHGALYRNNGLKLQRIELAIRKI